MTCINLCDTCPNVDNCFELLGFDVMVDDKMKPWLLEVNSSPAMAMDGVADSIVKPDLLKDTLKLIDFEPAAKYHQRITIRNSQPRGKSQYSKSTAVRGPPTLFKNRIPTSDTSTKIQMNSKFFDRRNNQTSQLQQNGRTSLKRLDSCRNENLHQKTAPSSRLNLKNTNMRLSQEELRSGKNHSPNKYQNKVYDFNSN